MSIITFNDESLKRHKVSRLEVLQALSDPLVQAVLDGESKQGNSTRVYVGYTNSDRLLEIGIEYRKDEEHVFHADNARSHFAKIFHNWRKHTWQN